MSFLRRLLGIGRPDPEEIFLRGRDAFAAGDYGQALVFFEKAAKRFSSDNMKATSVMNAAMAAQYANRPKYASELFYKVAVTWLRLEENDKKVS